jgi:hypothetical protein
LFWLFSLFSAITPLTRPCPRRFTSSCLGSPGERYWDWRPYLYSPSHRCSYGYAPVASECPGAGVYRAEPEHATGFS